MAQDRNLESLDSQLDSILQTTDEGQAIAPDFETQLDALLEGTETQQRGFFSSVSDPNALSNRGNLLPIAQAAMDKNAEIMANPNLPKFVKDLSPHAAAAAATAEELAVGVTGAFINAADNISDWFSNDPDLLDELQEAKQAIQRDVSPRQAERLRNIETVARTGATALATAGIGASAVRPTGFWARTFQGAKLGAAGGAAAASLDTLLSEDSSLTEQLISPFKGAAFGFGAGGLFSGAIDLGVKASSAVGIGRVRQLGNELAETFHKDPHAKKIFTELKKAGVKATVADIQPGRTAAKNRLLEAKAMSDAEFDLLDAITTKNQNAIARNFERGVVNSIDDLAKSAPEDLISTTAQKAHLDKISGQLRAAAANDFPDVYPKIDAGIPLAAKTSRILKADKVTDPSLLAVQEELAELTRAGRGADNALRVEAQAAFNKFGTHNTTKTLDLVGKSLSNKVKVAKLAGDQAKVRSLNKASRLVDKLMDETVPGYGEARVAIGKLSPFPRIANDPDLQQFFTRMDGDDVYKLLLDPKTKPQQHQALLDVLANGIKNQRGELVIPGNKPLLAAVIRDKMEQQFGKISDLNKNASQVFVQAFAKNPANRRMWDEAFRSISGRSLQEWQKHTRVIDAVFNKFGNNMLSDNFGTTLADLVSGDQIRGVEKILGYFRRKATFNFMFKKDWQKLLNATARQNTFSNQVDTLFGGLSGALGNELFKLDKKTADLMEANLGTQQQQGGLDANKKATRNRGF